MKSLAQIIAEESIVLLKNENSLLPLSHSASVSLFGRAQIKTVFAGNGSGGSAGEGATILDALTAAGLDLCPELADFYRREGNSEPDDGIDWDMIIKTGNSGLAYEIFGQYHAPVAEYTVPTELVRLSRAHSDTAVLVLGRSAGGEECDRRLHDDYLLTESETVLVDSVCGAFPHVVLVLNINGLVDLQIVEKYPSIESVIFMGVCGEDGGKALANIVTGSINPSGKLSFTVAKRYEDYPSAKDFSWDKDAPLTYESYGLDSAENGRDKFAASPVTVYREGIYTGYRYFDTFGIQPLYPFGHGLSYTKFSLDYGKAKKICGEVTISVTVTNVGAVPGRETVQLYISVTGTRLDHPEKSLCGFAKTKLLTPGESENVSLSFTLDSLASYDETTACHVVEHGVYLVKIGVSSADTQTVERIAVPEDIIIYRAENRLPLRSCNRNKISFVHAAPIAPESEECGIVITNDDLPAGQAPASAKAYDFTDYSNTELAALCVGYGPGIPFSSLSKVPLPDTVTDDDGVPVSENDHPTGRLGYVSPAMPHRDIHSARYSDGPAGVGGALWPSEMLLSCAFDRELWYRFGDAVGGECEDEQIDVWLAPAVNLHRNPLCGRNFEYLSEDPFLCGTCAVEIARGVQNNHPVIVCPKHFAANEQETYRRGSAKRNFDAVDSIIEERALREVYLKPFEMLVREADIFCIMTSFNKINSTFAAGSRDLCTHILREEWGFSGAIVTDWGDMDAVVDGADAVMAGNDIVMPGGPPVIRQIMAGLADGRLTREALETAVSDLFRMLAVLGKIPQDYGLRDMGLSVAGLYHN